MHRTIPFDTDMAPQTSSGAKPPRILVVEDDVDFADLVRFELETGGYDVETTSSVTDALRRMHEGSELALVITDVRLPGRSGIQILFPEDPDTKQPPVLVMSAFISPKLRDFVQQMGASVLEKPFSFATLHASVIRALRNAALGGSHTAEAAPHTS